MNKLYQTKNINMVHLYSKSRVFLTLGLLLISFLGFSQKIAVTGTITDSNDGSPLFGATVLEKGTSNGTTADFDGKYTINVAEGATLIVSFVGYEKQEIVVTGKVMDVKLVTSMTGLEEVLVIGYGVQKKSDKTGAVSNIQSEDLNGGVLTDPIQGLQGKTAGVSITKKGGDPNAGFAIKIRGSSGYGASTQPLFVIDGIVDADPTTVSQDDIESYNVLKDAASTAIYGSRGSNGVIIITTKSGSKEKNTVKLSTSLSLDRVANTLDMLTASEYRSFFEENDLNLIDGGGDVNWQDQIYRTGISQSHNISYSGGSKNSTYYASISNSSWEGIMEGTQKDRTSAKLNVKQHAFNERLTLDGTIIASFEENDYENYDGFDKDDIIYQAISHNPTDPVYGDDGEYYQVIRAFNYENPLTVIDGIDNLRERDYFLGGLNGSLKIAKGLKANAAINYVKSQSEGSYFRSQSIYAAADNGFGRKGYDNYEKKGITLTADYKTTISSVHNIDAIIGYDWEEKNWNGFYAQAENPQSDFLSYNNLGSYVDITSSSIGSWAGMSRLIGFFGRVQYNYNSKYYFTASLRRDGSTKFGENNKWGWFPTASASWNVHEEDFMDNDWLSQLKLRASYGISGNESIGQYNSMVVFRNDGSAINPETGEQVTVFTQSHNENPDLKWERTEEYNIGIDYGFFNDRLNGSIDVFRKNTNDLLGAYAVPVPPNQTDLTYVNTGDLYVQGIEFLAQGYIIDNTNFKWNSSFNMTYLQTEIGSLGDYVEGEIRKEGYLSGRGLIGDNNYVTGNIEGGELGAFYLPVYKGLSNDGVFLYESKTGGVTRNLSDAKRQVVGSPLPDFEFGWTNNFTFFKNWTLDISLRSMLGNDIYNATRMFFDYPGLVTQDQLNALPEALDWHEQGRTGTPSIADIYVEDGSFLKIDYLALGYNVPTTNIKWLQNMRVYVASNNLYTFTNYSGVDPETSYDGLSFGVDQYNVYPKTRTLTFGINATF